MLSSYQTPFFITKKVSNNAFHFEERKNPELFVPALKQGGIKDVKVGTRVVFEDFDDDGKLQSCIGLENFIKTSFARPDGDAGDRGEIPVYIFDNHNHALYFWAAEFAAGRLKEGSTLVHVDQHKDNRIPESFLSKEEFSDLEKVFHYTNTVLNVGNFIPSAQHVGLVNDVIFINSQYSIEQLDNKKIEEVFSGQPHEERGQSRGGKPGVFLHGLILDIDLDFFAPEFDYIPDQLKFDAVRRFLPLADVITVASSPFFIDQERALERLRTVFSGFHLL